MASLAHPVHATCVTPTSIVSLAHGRATISTDHSRKMTTGNTRSIPRSKTGCLTCRRRKKKCDERHPTCTACHRNALDCTWPTAETTVNSRRPRRRQNVSGRALPAELAAMVTVFAIPNPNLVRRLLHHFTQQGPMWLTSRTGPSRTAILFDLFPEAMECPLVLHCVLMTAAEDLLKYDPSVELQAAAVEYYGQAVAHLRESLDAEASGEALASGMHIVPCGGGIVLTWQTKHSSQSLYSASTR